jgi:RimJ/RimL family protein N-acetyltransferase
MTPLRTARLRLRHFTLDDAAFILELVNDPSWLRYIGDRNVHSLDDARRYLETGPIASYAARGYGFYCVELLEDATRIGMCGLVKRDVMVDVDIGFALLPAHVGRGYVTEAARAVVTQARDVFGLRRLAGVTNPDNRPSIGVLCKLGMLPGGTIRLRPEDSPILLFAMDL